MVHPSVTRYFLLGVPVDGMAPEQFNEVILELLESDKSHQIVFLTLPLLFQARHNYQLMQTLNHAALVLPVDSSISGGLAFLQKVKVDRYAPIDTVVRLLALLESNHKSAYLLGARKKWLEVVNQNLRTSFPQMHFVGRHRGYFKKEEQPIIVEAIRKAAPSILLTSKGVPNRDRWLYSVHKHLQRGLTVYVHDCYDVFANKKQRPSTIKFERGCSFKLSRILLYILYGMLLMVHALFKRKK
jgi:N-acetylglucosaminyldiphosphoundecaprenol N-acetyl-beta-D-mannosaminyltransferase